jgi:hypothetical protein
MAVRLRRIGLISSAKFGFVTGAVTAAPVGVVAAFVVRVVISWLRHMMEGWQRAAVDVGLLGKVNVDMVRVLGLGDALAVVRQLDELPLVTVVVVFVLVVAVVGALAAAATTWWAMAYNSMALLSGGLTIELEPESGGRVMVLRRDA